MLSQLKVILQYFCCLIGTLYLIGIWNDMKGIYSFFYEPTIWIAEKKIPEPEWKAYIPAEPSPILTGFYSDEGQFWLSMVKSNFVSKLSFLQMLLIANI